MAPAEILTDLSDLNAITLELQTATRNNVDVPDVTLTRLRDRLTSPETPNRWTSYSLAIDGVLAAMNDYETKVAPYYAEVRHQAQSS